MSPGALASLIGGIAMVGAACSSPTLTSTSSGPAPADPGDAGHNFAVSDADPVAAVDAETCAEKNYPANPIPLDLYLLMDGTGSMQQLIGGRTKQAMVGDAIIDFLNDPRSAGLGVGLKFYPVMGRKCEQDSDCASFSKPRCFKGPLNNYAVCQFEQCDSAEFEIPEVPIAPLPGNAAALNPLIAGRRPTGGNNDATALRGTYVYLQQYAAANPGRRIVLIYVTDGAPVNDGCIHNGIQLGVDEITKGLKTPPFIGTVVVGVGIIAGNVYMDGDPDPMDAVLKFAHAGGLSDAKLVDANNDLQVSFRNTLYNIRGAVKPCEYPIPGAAKADKLDFGRVNVTVTTVGAEGMPVGNVPNAESCNPERGGWYYNVAPSEGTPPTSIIACPATCKALTGDDKNIEVRVGCRTRAIE